MTGPIGEVTPGPAIAATVSLIGTGAGRVVATSEQALDGLPHMICYALKANSNQAVLKVLANLGAGMDVVSGGEYRRAKAAGVPGDRIVFSGVGKTAIAEGLAPVRERMASIEDGDVMDIMTEVTRNTWENRYRDEFEKKHGVRLGFMSFFAKASVEALKKFPVINASVEGTDIIYHNYYDIGIAVSTDRGLMVPVIRDVDRKSLIVSYDPSRGEPRGAVGGARDSRMMENYLRPRPLLAQNHP